MKKILVSCFIIMTILVFYLFLNQVPLCNITQLGEHIDKTSDSWRIVAERACKEKKQCIDSLFDLDWNSISFFLGIPIESVRYIEKDGSYNCSLRENRMEKPSYLEEYTYYEQKEHYLVYNETLQTDELFFLWGKGSEWETIDKSAGCIHGENINGHLCIVKLRPNWYYVTKFLNT